MAVELPWSRPTYTSVRDDIQLPWSGAAYAVVNTNTIAIPPWSNNAQVRLIAPPTMDWRPVIGPKVFLPTATGYKRAKALAPTSYTPYDIDAMLGENPWEIAHRGFGRYRPEMTMAAYDHAARIGAKAFEISVNISVDGYLVCNHDPYTDRNTNGAYYIPTTPWVGVLDQLSVSWSDTDTPERDDHVPLALLDEVVDKYGRTHVLWIQPKRDIDAIPIIEWLNQRAAYIDQEHVVLKWWRGQYPYATYGHEHGGWISCGFWLKTKRMAWMEYFDLLAQEWDATDAEWEGLVATGKRVTGTVMDNVFMRDTALAKGATGLMSMRTVKDL